MRALLKTTMMVATVVSFSMAQLQAARAGAPVWQNATTVEPAPVGYFADRAACPYGQHYACWYQPYGFRFCGCWWGGDRPACAPEYHYACQLGPNGHPNCACY